MNEDKAVALAKEVLLCAGYVTIHISDKTVWTAEYIADLDAVGVAIQTVDTHDIAMDINHIKSNYANTK